MPGPRRSSERLLITAGCATNPVTGKSQVVLISEPQEVEMGKQYYPLTNQMGEGVTPHRDIQALVQQVGQKMAKNSERPDLPWEFNVVDDNTPNAYALPGGKISITRGLISKMQNEDQLASVLGHEIGHVTARHQVVSASRDQLLGAALGVGSVAMRRGRCPGRRSHRDGGAARRGSSDDEVLAGPGAPGRRARHEVHDGGGLQPARVRRDDAVSSHRPRNGSPASSRRFSLPTRSAPSGSRPPKAVSRRDTPRRSRGSRRSRLSSARSPPSKKKRRRSPWPTRRERSR